MLGSEDGSPARDPCSLPVVDTGSQVTNWYRKSSVPSKALGWVCFGKIALISGTDDS